MRELRPSSELDTKALAQLVNEFSHVEALELDGGEKVEVEALGALQRLPSLRRLTIQVCSMPLLNTHATAVALKVFALRSCHL